LVCFSYSVRRYRTGGVGGGGREVLNGVWRVVEERGEEQGSGLVEEREVVRARSYGALN
jgi:hypothetical protein